MKVFMRRRELACWARELIEPLPHLLKRRAGRAMGYDGSEGVIKSLTSELVLSSLFGERSEPLMCRDQGWLKLQGARKGPLCCLWVSLARERAPHLSDLHPCPGRFRVETTLFKLLCLL